MSEEKQNPTEDQNQANQIVEMDGGIDPEVEEVKQEQETQSDQDQQPTDDNQTPEPDQEEQQPERAINQEAVDRKINKLTFEKYEERRRAEQLEKELQDARSKLSATDTDQIVIPELPDAFDPEYDTKMQLRDEALKKHAEKEAQRAYDQRLKDDQAKKDSEAEREKLIGHVNNMYDSAEKAGISKEDLQKADNTVAMFIRDKGLATFIISHEKAPLIVNHLANNISELEKIGQMNPIQAAAHIATSIIPVAEKFKPNLPKTPDPIEIPTGKKKGGNNPYLEGVTME